MMFGASDAQLWIRDSLATLTGRTREEIPVDSSFDALGLTSANAILLARELSRLTGRSIAPIAIWEFPTVGSLAAHLSGELGTVSVQGSSSGPATEPVAIVGMSCRFPGAPDLEGFWSLLTSERVAFRDIPADRWPSSEDLGPDPSGRTVRRAGLLDHVDQFDPAFFGISPREAVQMDPQQRLSLEIAWEAFENAGIPADALRDSETGVFMGVTFADYAHLHLKSGAEITQHTGAGQAFDIIASRISYFFGLQGPSLAVNTACSSSLVAVHLACASLRSGETDLALAGGVNLVLSAETMAALTMFGALSPDGRCRPFDAAANGFVHGEGAGAVVLKRLSRAVSDGDRIYAVILSTATNNDGASNGLSAPNPAAQERLLRRAYEQAGVDPAQVHYVEAHGTSTPLGDPIEARALGRVLGAGRPARDPLRIGSVKSQVGHLEGAAGIAGLIKTALSLWHRHIPASLGFETPSPWIPFDELGLQVQRHVTPWPDDGRPAIAGVSSFGWGGTNCHAVLREANPGQASVLAVSAANREALDHNIIECRARLERGSSAIEVSADAGCSVPAPSRTAWVWNSTPELREHMVAGTGRIDSATIDSATSGRLAFVFSPLGGQWAGMGRALLEAEPVFRRCIEDCDLVTRESAGWSLLDVLWSGGAGTRLSTVEVSAPAVVSIQIALCSLWRSWGVEPDAVVGHSLGEIPAAFASQVLSLADAVTVALAHGRALAAAPSGALAVVGLDKIAAGHHLERHGPDLVVAADNGPVSTLVSGAAPAVERLVAALQAEGVYASLVDVPKAPHSPAVDGVLDGFRAEIQSIRPRHARIPLISTVTGEEAAGVELGPEYWPRSMRDPVGFAPAFRTLTGRGFRQFIEIGPHPLLGREMSGMCREALVLRSMRRHEDARRVMLDALARLYVSGRAVDWRRFLPAAFTPSAVGPSTGVDDTIEAQPFVLSAKSREALSVLARRAAENIQQTPTVPIRDFCMTSTVRRSHLSHRLAFTAESRSGLVSALNAWANGNPGSGVIEGLKSSARRSPVAYVVCGQGAQWPGMGLNLLDDEPVFRDAVEECAAAVEAHGGCRVVEELRRLADSRIDETEVAQPALFALQVGLARLWQSWGIPMDGLAGHSVGEISVAHLSGALSLDDAACVAVHRSRLMQRATGGGAMVAVALDEAASLDLLAAFGGAVEVAAVNSPVATVWSGEPAAIEAAIRVASSRGIPVRRLPVRYAFHSRQMVPFENELREALRHIQPKSPQIPVWSSLTGSPATPGAFGPDYWARLREPVRFGPAIQGMLDSGFRTFLEIGSHPVLGSSISECLDHSGETGLTLASLRRQQGGRRPLHETLCRLFVNGYDVAWDRVSREGRMVSLPPYPWQRQRYWISGPGLVRRTNGGSSESASPSGAADSDLAYRIDWIPQAVSGVQTGIAGRRFLVFEDRGGVGASLCRQIELHGGSCVRVLAGTQPGESGFDFRTIRRGAPADYQRLAADISRPGFGVDVIHLWSCDSPGEGGPDVRGVQEAQTTGCKSVLLCVQALESSRSLDDVRLWVGTAGASGGDVRRPEASPVWGLVRVLGLERPGLGGALVDMDPDDPPELSAAHLFDVIRESGGENQVAFRAGSRLVPRLVRQSAPGAASHSPMDVSGTYLVTGGTGALGLSIAHRLVQRGVRNLVLVARGPASRKVEHALDELRRTGVSVKVVAADVADSGRIRDVIESIPRLRGVIHAAGVVNPEAVERISSQSLDNALHAKVAGGWNLHQLTRHLDLDCFVCFSSIASVWGAHGMGAYAAANQFLDALAAYRRTLGLRAISINWGPWSGEGMAARSDVDSRVRGGIRPLDPEVALDHFDWLMNADTPSQVVVADVDWSVFRPVFEARARRPFLDRIDTATSVRDQSGRGELLRELRGMKPEDRSARLRSVIVVDVRTLLGWPPGQPIDLEQGFFEMGMDSLMAVEFKKSLECALDCDLPRTVAFEFPNVIELTRHVMELVFPAEAGSRSGEPADTYAGLSESAAEDLLVKRLSALRGTL